MRPRVPQEACAVVVKASSPGCFLHFGEFFSSIDGVNVNPFFGIASLPTVTEIVLDSNFVNFHMERIDPIATALLVSAGKPYQTATRRLWFEGAVEQLDDTLLRDVLLPGMWHAVDIGLDGVGITNLKDPAKLQTIMPPQMIALMERPARAWKPTALLCMPYEMFYASHKYECSAGQGDVMQNLAHRAYHFVLKACGGCQVQVIGDVAALVNTELLRATRLHRYWLRIPDALAPVPGYVRDTLEAVVASDGIPWRILEGRSPHHMCPPEGCGRTVLPIMGRGAVFIETAPWAAKLRSSSKAHATWSITAGPLAVIHPCTGVGAGLHNTSTQ